MNKYTELAEVELERADSLMNTNPPLEATLRERLYDHCLTRAGIYSNLAISEELNHWRKFIGHA